MAEGQLSPSGARIVDAPITTAARGYKNPMAAWPFLFPAVEVGARGGQIVTFRAEDFLKYEIRRAPGAQIARLDVGYDGSPFTLVQRALEVPVPIEVMEDARAEPSIELGTVAAVRGRRTVDFQIELEAARLATADASYDAANIITLSDESQWTHASSTPQKEVQDAKAMIRQGIGLNPNTLVVGAEVHDALRSNADVIDRVKHTMAPERVEAVTMATLAAYFGVEHYVVGECMQGEPGSFTHVWGKFAILAYTEVTDLASMGSPTFGYTYRLSGYPVVEQPYYDERTRTWVYPYITQDTPVVAGKPAGVLFKAVVA